MSTQQHGDEDGSTSDNGWLRELIGDGPHDCMEELADAHSSYLLPVVQNFLDAVEGSAKLRTLFHQMFQEQIPKKSDSMAGDTKPKVKDYRQLFCLLNATLMRAPQFSEAVLVGCPIYAIMLWSMATPSGYAAFLNDTVNFHLKQVLDHWGQFLKSPESCYVLTEDPKRGWFGESARRKMPGFVVQFKCNPTEPHYGFKSWDDFFTREFRDGVRPVAAPADDRVIVHACEAAPYKIQYNVLFQDTFWIKSQNYSLRHMLGDDPEVSAFIGGTVYIPGIP